MGLIPMVYPDYQSVADDDARARFQELWGAELDPEPGLTVVEIMDAAPGRRHPGHVHHGREPGHVGPGPGPRPPGPGRPGLARGPGDLPHRDRRLRRRHPPGLRVPGEDGHVHQHRPPRPARPPGPGPAGPGPPGPVDHPGAGPAHSAWTGLPRPGRRLRRDPPLHAQHGRDHLGPPRAEHAVTYPCRRRATPAPRSSSRTGSPRRRPGPPQGRGLHPAAECPTTSTPWSSSPAASSSTGTPAP
jgi:hypothetical protein